MSLNKKGDKYKNFIVTKYLPIDEINCILIELKHEKLGCEVIKILNDDEENLFSLSFKTYPDSSNGAPHILEHTVLCGSKKFPVKDPFFSMIKRSLNTFMNAMTGSDFTCYPASSCLEKDFYNLFEVYIDAVFHPNLNELSFLQEGHRFEFSIPDDASSDLIYKGVVYNEMKGSMANPDNVLFQHMMKHLTPDLPYAYNSGGDPKEIPNLTYEKFKNFHKKFYHPSKCLFFLYGNLSLEKQLDFIEKNALAGIIKTPELEKIKRQKRFEKPVVFEDRYPIQEGESIFNKSIISFGYLTCDIENQIDLYGLAILDNILMGTDGAILKLSLLGSNLCMQADSLLDTEMSEIPYIIILKGCEAKNSAALLSIITTTLEKLKQSKIPQMLIDASLHQLEFMRSEITHDHAPYGLTLFFRSALAKQHNIEPENSLVIHTLFKTLKEKLSDPSYIPYLIDKYFLNNNHLVKLILNPDSNLMHEMDVEEKTKLEKIQSKLDPSDIEKIITQADELQKFQKLQEKQSLDCLPKIKTEDILKNNKNYPLKIEKIKNFNIFHHSVFTNEILYVDLMFDLPDLSSDEVDLLSLYSSLLTEIGANKRSYIENLEYIQLYTGGIGTYLPIHIQAEDFNKAEPQIAIKTKCLNRNSQKLFSLIKDILTTPNFDDSNRIKEILLQQYTYLEHSLVKNSMKYASLTSQASLSYPASLSSKWHGPNYLTRLKSIIENIDKKLSLLIEDLKKLHKKVFLNSKANLVLSCSDEMYKNLRKNDFYDLLDLQINLSPLLAQEEFFEKSKKSSIQIIPAPVAFIASSYKTVGFLDQNSAYLLIASQLFENKVLHKKIREMGGAYGSSASYFATSGIFTFSSFRDPHIKSTLKAFKQAIEEIAKGNFEKSDLDEAILQIIQHTDVPISPGAKAITAYSWLKSKKTDEMRQHFRDKILTCTKKDILDAVKTNLLNQIDSEVTKVFTGKEIVEKEDVKMDILNIF
ncbi:MAG: insulinase family protein [Parachlamydiales bacterium]|nr:insulinase family protein [Parachlamydiales bacterium]